MRMIAKFSKGEDLKFCSHLDTQRIFIRAIARADIPVRFSQGFNKHPLLSMALALPVGESSSSEFIDVTMEDEIDCQEFADKMNRALPEGIRIIEAKMIDDGGKSLTSLVFAAEYCVKLCRNVDFTEKIIEILNKNDIIIDKKTKSGIAPTDIRGMILNLKQKENMVICCVRCGQMNLKPRDLMGLLTDETDFKIERKVIYTNQDDQLSELFSFL